MKAVSAAAQSLFCIACVAANSAIYRSTPFAAAMQLSIGLRPSIGSHAIGLLVVRQQLASGLFSHGELFCICRRELLDGGHCGKQQFDRAGGLQVLL